MYRFGNYRVSNLIVDTMRVVMTIPMGKGINASVASFETLNGCRTRFELAFKKGSEFVQIFDWEGEDVKPGLTFSEVIDYLNRAYIIIDLR